MLPMFVVTKLPSVVPAATGTLKIKSFVFFVYHSIDPLKRCALIPKSRPTL